MNRRSFRTDENDIMKEPMNFEDYSISLSPIPEDEGGGYMVTFPDLPGCLADGDTVEEAIAEARDAFNAWMAAVHEDKNSLS